MGSGGESSGRKRAWSPLRGHGEKPSSSWARLVSADSLHSDVEIQADEMIVDSMIIASDTPVTQKWCKIHKNMDTGIVKLQNISSSGMLINGELLQRGEQMVITSESEIVLGPQRIGYPIYNFQTIHGDQHKKSGEKVLSYTDNMKCSICLYTWHDVVSVTPCLHNFCNACFSQWYKRSIDKGANCICPQCRSDIYSVGRNHTLHNIVEDMLKDNPSLQRSAEDTMWMDKIAMVTSDVMIIGNSVGSRKCSFTISSGSDDESSDDETELQCPQCEGAQGSAVGGFHCGQETTHLTCHSCWGLMPLRTDIAVPQMCVGCGKVHCGAYWHSLNILNPGSFIVACNNDGLLPISERAFLQTPHQTHQGNAVEQDITERYIHEQGKTVQHIVREWNGKLDSGEIDQPKLSVVPMQPITSATYLCNDCANTVAAHLLNQFRLSVPKSELPPDAAAREDCWYGHQCRTQHHKETHARKLNHVCKPTRRARQ